MLACTSRYKRECERSQQVAEAVPGTAEAREGNALGDWGRMEVVVNFSTGEGFWCGHQLRVLAIVKLGKWILYVVHIRQSLHPVITESQLTLKELHVPISMSTSF